MDSKTGGGCKPVRVFARLEALSEQTSQPLFRERFGTSAPRLWLVGFSETLAQLPEALTEKLADRGALQREIGLRNSSRRDANRRMAAAIPVRLSKVSVRGVVRRDRPRSPRTSARVFSAPPIAP